MKFPILALFSTRPKDYIFLQKMPMNDVIFQDKGTFLGGQETA